jgi:hypothetical protein
MAPASNSNRRKDHMAACQEKKYLMGFDFGYEKVNLRQGPTSAKAAGNS